MSNVLVRIVREAVGEDYHSQIVTKESLMTKRFQSCLALSFALSTVVYQ